MVSVLIASIATFIFGSLWYTVLFGKKWSALMGFSEADMAEAKKESMAGKMFIMFINNVISATALYMITQFLPVDTFMAFFSTVLLIWLGFSFPEYLGPYLWERKPIQLVYLNVSYAILNALLLSLIIYFV